MKLVLQSERMYFAEPRMKKRLRVLMKLEVSSDLIPSMGIALVFMQVNITAHRFAVGQGPLLVLRGETYQGANTFSRTLVSGWGSEQRRSAGRLAIFGISVGPHSLRHVKQWEMFLHTYVAAENPESGSVRIVPSVKRRP